MLQRRHVCGSLDIVDRIITLVEHTGCIPSTTECLCPRYMRGRARARANASVTGPAGALNFVGDLDAAGRGTDHQHARRRQAGPDCDSAQASAYRLKRAAPAASAGTCATLQAPVANTTASHCQLP
jgi:hypothetical protein